MLRHTDPKLLPNFAKNVEDKGTRGSQCETAVCGPQHTLKPTINTAVNEIRAWGL